jgi:hypothetical protein
MNKDQIKGNIKQVALRRSYDKAKQHFENPNDN